MVARVWPGWCSGVIEECRSGIPSNTWCAGFSATGQRSDPVELRGSWVAGYGLGLRLGLGLPGGLCSWAGSVFIFFFNFF